jgi:agmatinase
LGLGADPVADLRVVDYGDIEPKPGDLDGHVVQVRERVTEVLDAGAIPVVLGGDHSLAYPTLTALSDRLGVDGFCVVQFDTHADTGEVYGGRLTHGNPFRILIDEGRLDGNRLWQLGLRGYWPGPPIFEWMRAAGIRWRTADEIDRDGLDSVLAEVIEDLRSFKCPVYLSIDIDVLDPAYAPGTGTPEPGGLTTRELLRMVRTIALAVPIAGIEVVEVSPPYDHADVTALAAHRCILEVLAAVAAARSRAGTA